MWITALIGCLLLLACNILISLKAHRNYYSSDKDIFLPVCTILTFLYPLMIYLPEAHFQITKYLQTDPDE